MPGAALFTILALLLFSLSGCAEYKFKNYAAYGSLGAAGAAQFDTLDSNSSILTLDQFIKQVWENPTDPVIALHVSSYEDLITGLQTMCSDHPGACTQEVVSAMRVESAKLAKFKRHHKLASDYGAAAAALISPAWMTDSL